MLNKLVVVVLDGLCFDTARSQMGFLNHLVEKKVGVLYKVKSELPSMSRPLYETILTGVYPYKSGITNNNVCRLSKEKSIFSLVKEAGGMSCAAAYYWISELYNKAPFQYLQDCYQDDESRPIQHGRFYFEDSYPDSHLFIDGEVLRKKYIPDFLYIHPMGADYVGHKYGSDSKEYNTKAIALDVILSEFIPLWLNDGYKVIVTSDHGMNEDGNHGGTGEYERNVPFYYFGGRLIHEAEREIIKQTQIAPIICKVMGVGKSEYMEECKY